MDAAIEPVSARRAAGQVARVVWLGAVGGAWSGLLVGGVGGRLAMLVLRLTSPEGMRGRKTDDGFTIGVVSRETLFLLGATLILGATAGVVYVALRAAVPRRWRVPVWTVLGLLVGGSAMLHGDGVDFHALRPLWLAVLMFLALPASGGWLMAVLIERCEPWWWTADRRRTLLCSVVAAPLVLALVPVLAVLLVAGLVAVAGACPVRQVYGRAVTMVVRAGLVVVASLAAVALVNDLTGIL